MPSRLGELHVRRARSQNLIGRCDRTVGHHLYGGELVVLLELVACAVARAMFTSHRDIHGGLWADHECPQPLAKKKRATVVARFLPIPESEN